MTTWSSQAPASLLSFNQVNLFSQWILHGKMHISGFFRILGAGDPTLAFWKVNGRSAMRASLRICHTKPTQTLQTPALPHSSPTPGTGSASRTLPFPSRIFEMLLPTAHVAAAFVVLPWKAGNSAAAFLPLPPPARGQRRLFAKSGDFWFFLILLKCKNRIQRIKKI